MNHFEYRGNELYCEGVPLARIADEVGTPTYVYSYATLERHYRVFDEALSGVDHLICYAVKANSNLAVLSALAGMGAGADIVSGGELSRFLRAGGEAAKVVFSGVGKTEAEIRQSLEAGILCFNVESEDELHAIDRIAGDMGVRAPISVRVNPDVDPQTHPYISTGLKKNKFGIARSRALDVYQIADGLAHIDVVGVDCHIGSQLTRTEPFRDAIARLVELILELKGAGINIEHVDIGGGLGIPYGEEGEADPPSPAVYGEMVREGLKPLSDLDIKLLCEPGRVIVGNAGGLITRVLYRKEGEDKRFVIVDAAFNDLLRPTLYQSHHPMRPVARDSGRAEEVVDIVGPICETGDFLARDRSIARLENGELLFVGAAGAYGFVMASNYNTRPRAPEVLVKGDAYAVVRRRETVDELLAHESIPDFL